MQGALAAEGLRCVVLKAPNGSIAIWPVEAAATVAPGMAILPLRAFNATHLNPTGMA